MLYRIVRILIFFVLIGLAHGAYVQLSNSRYDKNAVYEYREQKHLARLEHYLFASTHARLVLTGTSVTVGLPIAAFRVPAENLAMAGGVMTVLDLLNEQPTLPSIILVETNYILNNEGHNWNKKATAVQKRLLKQCQTRFRPSVMLLTELTNSTDKAKGSGQDESTQQPSAPGSSSQNALKEQVIQNNIDIHQEVPPSEELNKAVAHTKKRIDQFSKRGAHVILIDMPMDPRIAATPYYTHIRSAVRAAFPADHYQWISLRPDLFEFTDGMHLTPKNRAEAARLLDQAIASLGLYQ